MFPIKKPAALEELLRDRRCGPLKAVWRAASVLALVAAFLSLKIAEAQTPTPDSTNWLVSIGQFDASKYPEITIYANVTDRQGNQIGGLKASDFTVSEDDQIVAISAFAGMGEVRPVDIIYVFDTTASMTEEIAGVVKTSLAFADELERRGRDFRLGLVTFGDQVMLVQRPDKTLTADAAEFKTWVSGLGANGGDLEPENDYAAIQTALQFSFRSGSQVVLILITDAPPHRFGDPVDSGVIFDDPKADYQPVLDALKTKGASIYAIAPSLDAFTDLAEETSGRLYDIHQNPDFTGLIAGLGTTLANQYRITYISPRPTNDGTRRNVQVRVGGASAGEVYAEAHLLSVTSNCLVGLMCLLPLAFMLLAPPLVQRGLTLAGFAPRPKPAGEPRAAIVRQPALNTPQVDAIPPTEFAGGSPYAEPAPEICPHCGNRLRSGARFCSRCGRQI